jgi:hypothetical protein
MNKISIILVAIVMYSCNANNTNLSVETNTSSQIFTPKSKIKYIRTYTYSAGVDKGVVVKGIRTKFFDLIEDFNRYGRDISDKSILYNELGDILEETLYGISDSIEEKKNYKYDKDGNRIEFDNIRYTTVEHKFHHYSGKYKYEKGKLIELTWCSDNVIASRYKYNEDGYMIEEYRYFDNFGFKLIFEYNDNGDVIIEYKQDLYAQELNIDAGIISDKVVYYDNPRPKELRSSYTYEYDYDKNMKAYKKFDADGNLLEKKEYDYDAGKRIVDKVVYDSDGKFSERWIYEYDSKGNRKKVALYDSYFKAIIGIAAITWSYRYEYDLNNNWNKNIIYVNSKVRYIIEREIEYFELK